MKALVGKQGNLPQHLQDAIKAAPEKSPAKSYGKSPMKKDPKLTDDVVISTKKREEKRKRGGTDIVTTEVSEKGGKGLGTTAGDRRGVGRIQEKEYRKMKGTGRKGSKGSVTKRKVSGSSGKRKDGSGILIEKTASTIKPKSYNFDKKKQGSKSPAKMTTDPTKKGKGKAKGKMETYTEATARYKKEGLSKAAKEKSRKKAAERRKRLGIKKA